ATRRGHLPVLERCEVPGAHWKLGAMLRPVLLVGIAIWVAGCSSVPQAIPGETEVLVPIAPQGQTRFPLFLSWYENCDPRGCDVDRERAQVRLVECLNEGLQKTHPQFAVHSGGSIGATQPSVLVEDPRLRGEPDARLSREWSDKVKSEDARYAVLMET